MNSFQKALYCYNKALELSPENSEYLTLKGNNLKRMNKLGDAVACYDKAIRIDAKYAPAYFFKSQILFEQKEYEAALIAINKACEIKPLQKHLDRKNNMEQKIENLEKMKE